MNQYVQTLRCIARSAEDLAELLKGYPNLKDMPNLPLVELYNLLCRMNSVGARLTKAHIIDQGGLSG